MKQFLLFNWMAILAVLPAWGADSVAARLDRLEAHQAIETLMIRYGQALDAHDWDKFAGLFGEDGIWTSRFGSVHGTKAMKDFLEANVPKRPFGSYHLFSNFEIRTEGDKGTVWAHWAIVSGTGTPGLVNSGHYEVTVVRKKGEWTFAHLTVFNDLPNIAIPASK